MTTKADFSAFVAAYIEAAIWLATDDHGDPIASDSELASEAHDQAILDCKIFAARMEAAIGTAYPRYRHARYSDPEMAGHDLWLTRNGHGAGFWDRGLGTAGDILTELANALGESDLYRGDDQLFYFA